VFQGWSVFVLDLATKEAERKQFLAQGTPPEARREFLHRYGITEVVLPRDLGDSFDAGKLEFLAPRATFGQYTIYSVLERRSD
jgi:hypothetical protein